MKKWFVFGLLASVLGWIAIESQDSFARAGRGRSVGNRGYSRPSSPPPSSQSYRQQPSPAAPSPGFPQPQRPSMMRGLMTGIAGGFLGSALFSSLGFGGHGGGGGFGGGGLGLMEILIIGGIGYFLYRKFVANRGQTPLADGGPSFSANRSAYAEPTPITAGWKIGQDRLDDTTREEALALPANALPPDEASNLFFRIQGAWSKADLKPVNDIIDPEVLPVFEEDIKELHRLNQRNKLENIAVRNVTVVDTWREGNLDYAAVLFDANLLDYKIDATTQKVIEGSDQTPVRFLEEWTFRRAPGSPWRLSAIEQK